MTEGIEATSAGEELTDIVDRDVQCVSCGYNLRGLGLAGVCPECGCPVEHSLHGDWLRYADGRWTKQILRGLRWAMVSRDAFAITIVGAIIMAVIGFITTGGDADSPAAPALRFAIVALGAAIGLLPIGVTYGFWLASSPEPREGAAGLFARLWTRIISVLVIPAIGLWFALSVSRSTPFGTSIISVHVPATLCFVIMWLHLHVVLDQVRVLERRCQGVSANPPERITKFRRRAIYLPAILLVVNWFGCGQWSPTAGPISPPGPISFLFMACGWVIITGMLTSTIGLIRAELSAAADVTGAALKSGISHGGETASPT